MAQGVNDLACLWRWWFIPGLMQWVKDAALRQLCHRLQLQLGFDPWLRNFHMSQGWWEKKKKKRILLGGSSQCYTLQPPPLKFG